MLANLLHYTPLYLAASAIRMSKDNHHLSDTIDGICGPKDRDLIDRIGIKLHHESTLEMIDYIWDVEFSTKTLLGLTRHRIGVSMCVRSTRYTTHKLLKADDLSIFIEPSGNQAVDASAIATMQNIKAMSPTPTNDELSLLLPQSFIYRAQLKLNARSLRHFFSLRNPSTHAHLQIQDLATRLYQSIPEDHKFLYDEYFTGEPNAD